VKNPETPAPGSNPGSTVPKAPGEKQNEVATVPESDQKHSEAPRRDRDNAPRRAGNKRRIRKEVVNNPQFAINELQEGRAAKDELMRALRLASAKLNFAQKKTQNTSPRDPVHNQHKIG